MPGRYSGHATGLYRLRLDALRAQRQRAHRADHGHQAHALAHRDVLAEQRSTISGETVAISAGVRPESVLSSIVAIAFAEIPDGFSTAK